MAEDSESESPSGTTDGDETATGEGDPVGTDDSRDADADATESPDRDASDESDPSDDAATNGEAGDGASAGEVDAEGGSEGDDATDAEGDDSEGGAIDEPAFDPDTDRFSTDAEAPVQKSVDPDMVDVGEIAPGGETGMDDPVPEAEREASSDAIGAAIRRQDWEVDEDVDVEDIAGVTSSPATDGEAVSDGESVESDAGHDATAPEVTDADVAEAEPVDDGADWADGLVGEGPTSDQEMPLADHIEEMVKRLAVVLVVGGVVTLAVFPVADQLINFLWNTHIPGAETVAGRRPRLYGPLELLLTELKVAALAGFVVGLPVAVYETYLFMRPGLFPHERRYYLAAVPTSLVLALVGVAFAHFVVLPAIFAYFTSYTTGTAVIAFGLKETFSLILVLMGYMALVFQIPLFIMLAIMMNLTSRVWLEDKRLLFWGGFLGVAFLISPDPTGMAPIIVAATMIVLFEGTLALLRWTGN